MARKFTEIQREILADPERRAAIEREKAAMRADLDAQIEQKRGNAEFSARLERRKVEDKRVLDELE